MSHTPGSWEVLNIEHKASIEIRARDKFWPVARVRKNERRGPDRIKPEQALANARLMAASPSLLKALKLCRDKFESIEKECRTEQIEQAIHEANMAIAEDQAKE